jgi:hypothetical protein
MRRAISQPNWKFTRWSSIDHDAFVAMYTPSFVSPRMSASEPSRGSIEMLVMRISGKFAQPSARIAPLLGRPSTLAVSRLEMKFSNTPSTMIGTLCAGTPSSSHPNAGPPGHRGVGRDETSGLAYRSEPRSSGRTNEDPA